MGYLMGNFRTGKYRIKLHRLIEALLVTASICAAQTLPPVVPEGRPVVGLALEGGGALGLAHVGVLTWMEEHHIPVDRLAGTSMGSLVGALYASGRTPAELRTLATSDLLPKIFTLQSPYSDINFRRRQDRREMPESFTVGLRHGPQLRNALLSDRGVNAFLATSMVAYNTAVLDYDQMPIPFRCVATDLNTLGPVVFSRGPLPDAVRASISIPGVFPPVQGVDGHSLIDGGIVDNLPTDIVRREMHADVVIAVHLASNPVNGVDTGSVFSVLNRAFSAGVARNEDVGMKAADLLISVPLDAFTSMDYEKGDQLIEAGYRAAEQNRAALMKYALDDTAWSAYLAARRARIRPEPGTLRRVRIVGSDAGARASVASDIQPLEGQPLRPDSTLNALKGIQSGGGYRATYETFAADNAAPDNGLLIHLGKDPIGPPYLLIGPEVAGITNNLMRMALNLRLVDQNLGGFGSELRATARLGYMNGLSVEYYRLLSPSGYFVEPMTHVSTEPVYIWQNQARIAERSLVNLTAGLSAGRTFSNTLQIAAEWRFQNTHWNMVTGSGGGPYLSGSAQSGQLRLDIDHARASTVSPDGWRLTASAGALYHAAQSSNAPLLHLAFSRNISLHSKNIFGVSGEADSYLRANVAQPYRFTLGGPLRLTSASFDEYRGTDIGLVRTAYMRRIAALPTGIGHGLYGTFGYEAGEVWSPEQKAFLRQDGILGLVGNTPLGVITVGVSAGDAGRRKVFFTLGRWF
jgi:NTE family protein